MPLIGLSTYVERAQWGVWNQRAALLPMNYIEVVARVGGLPVLLPPIVTPDIEAAATATVAGLHGLVLTGGSDVDPEQYGAPAHTETDAPHEDRDAWELALLRAALATDQPVLAVCRGAQLLNVALGGTLHQHLPEVVGEPTHRPALGSFGRVRMEVDPTSRLGSIVGAAPDGQCHHHQAIDRLGDGLTVCARAADGTVEGVEVVGARFALGVQWHPEEDGDERLFAALVEAASTAAT